MSQVRDLAGKHLGKTITITTDNTTATGVLQGIEVTGNLINDSNWAGDSWVLGKTEATITLLPGQRIIAQMADAVTIEGGSLSLSDNVHQLVNEHLKMGPDGKRYTWWHIYLIALPLVMLASWLLSQHGYNPWVAIIGNMMSFTLGQAVQQHDNKKTKEDS